MIRRAKLVHPVNLQSLMACVPGNHSDLYTAVAEIEGDWIFHLEADGLFLLVSLFDRGKYSYDTKETVLIPWSNVVSITHKEPA
jgi:hypothetical protein